MSNTILIKRSGTLGAIPSSGNLSLGELAINYADGNLFYKNSSGIVAVIASNQFLSVVGNVTANNGMFTNIVNTASFTGGIVSVTGNVTGSYIIGNGSQLTGVTASNVGVLTTLSVTGNATVGNLLTNGIVSAAGNVTGNYILGNGAFLSGVITSVANINNGTSNVTIGVPDGNITVGVSGVGNVIVWTPTGEYVTGDISASGNITAGNISTSGSGGNITGANVITAVTMLASQIGNASSYLYGDGSNITNIGNANVTQINNGMSNVVIPTANGNVYVNADAGTQQQWNFDTNGYLTTPFGGMIVQQYNQGTTDSGKLMLANSASGYANGLAGLNQGDGNNTIYLSDNGFELYTNSRGTENLLSFNSVGNLSSSGNIIALNGNVDALNFNGNVFGTTLSATGNINGGNINATGNVTGGNLVTSGPSGNISGANVITSNTVIASSSINTNNFSITGTVIGNLVPSANVTYNLGSSTALWKDLYLSGSSIYLGSQAISSNASGVSVGTGDFAANNLNALNAVTAGTTISAGGNIVGGNISTAGNVNGANVVAITLSATANVVANNVMATTIVNAASFTGTLVSVTGNVIANNGQFTTTVNTTSFTGTVVSVNGNITGANISTGGVITATGNITSSGNVSAGNLITGGLISATGNISTGANIGVSGYATVVGNVIAGNLITDGVISTAGNVQAANVNSILVAATTVSATGNVNGGNINSNNIVGTALAIKSTGDLTLAPSGNISVNSRWINNVAYPYADTDAANKLYVDTVAQGLHVHPAANIATTNDLATWLGIPSGNVTYTQPGPEGVGATLTFVGNSLTALDGQSVTSGMRLLIKNQSNAVTNGVYTTTANLFVITRSTDMDNDAELAGGDFLFVTSGVVNGDTSWVQTTDNVVIGTSNIVFTQFSGAGTYSANTSAGLTLTGTVFSAKVDGNTNPTTAFDINGNIYVPAGAAFTTPNIGAATGTSLTTTGNVTGGNINTDGIVSAAKGVQNTPIGNAIANTGAFTTLTANGAVTFTSNVQSSGYTTGALVVSGGMGLAGNLELPGTSQIHVGSELSGGFAGAQLLMVSNVNSYSQAVKQNISEGAGASSDFVATANNGDDSNFYIDMGINSNNYSDSNYTSSGPNDGYLYVNGGNLVLGTQTTGKNIVFHAGDTLAANIVATLSYTNLTLSQDTVSTSSSSGALIVAGTDAGVGVAGNIYAGGLISATGNIAGNYVLGNGYYLTGVITSVANINNGTSNITVVSSGGNITASVGGTSNVVVWATTGEYVTGVVSVSGNITGANINTGGLISATGNVNANNGMFTTIVNTASFTGGLVSVTGNITANNVISNNIVNAQSFTGNIVSVIGNVTANSGIFSSIVNANSFTGNTVSVLGNITGGNLTTDGIGNVATLIVTTLANITATTISTSSTTGAMTIAGGLGVVGNIYGGALYDNGTAVLTINSTVDGGTY